MFLWLLLNFVFAKNIESVRWPQNLDCSGEKLKIDELSESGLKVWLKKNGSQVSDVSKFICCLPNELKYNYIVAHSSIAAQNGVPKSPRVIFFDVDNSLRALSVNGGDHTSLMQDQSVEIAFVNAKTKELEYFDLEFSGTSKPRLSVKNPPLCMSCHGGGNPQPVGGARPIFDSFGRWNRFVGGRSPFCSETEAQFYKRVDDLALMSVQNNPRYKCLNLANNSEPYIDRGFQRPTYPEHFRRLTKLDTELTKINNIRVAKIIRNESYFQKNKKRLFGYMICGGEFEDWIDTDTLKKIKSGVVLKKTYRDSSWASAAKNDIEQQLQWIRKAQDEMHAALDKNSSFGDLAITPPPLSEVRCENQADEVYERFTQQKWVRFSSQFKSDLQGDVALVAQKYFTQSLIDGVRGDVLLRMIFEAQGIDTGFWQMSATNDGTMNDFFPLTDVFRQEWSNDKNFRHFVKKYFIQTQSFPSNDRQMFALSREDGILIPKNQDSCSVLQKDISSKNN